MNILPKKRWHVRTKENIARVRKDEAEAAEKERQEKSRIETADREARINLLKQKSKQKLHELGAVEADPVTPITHINLFADLDHAIKTTNKDHDKDFKEKKEEYEKKIGYLTYLGQDTNEALKKKNWYEVAPESTRFTRSNDIKDTYDKLVLRDEDGKPKEKKNDDRNGEICWKQKQNLDPINAFKKYCHGSDRSNYTSVNKCDDKINQKGNHNNRHKNIINTEPKKGVNSNKERILKLREARLKREREEKYKTEMFLSGLNGSSTIISNEQDQGKVRAKYNSQFNPELARQNYK